MPTERKWVQIDPAKFIWDYYLSKQNCGHRDIYGPGWFGELHPLLLSEVTPIGWCHAKDLKVRPRTEGIAILVELEDGLKVWLHAEELPRLSAKDPTKENLTSDNGRGY